MTRRMTRRELLRLGGLGSVMLLAAACQPKVVEKEVTKVVKEVVEVVKEVTPEPAPKGKTEIIYYDRTSDATRWGERFNEVQDQIELSVEIQPPGTRYEQLVAAITAGNAPDVIGLDCVQVGRFAGIGALAPLDDLIEPGIRDKYFQHLISTPGHFGSFRGELLGVPFWIDMSVIYYNKAFLQEAGGDPDKGLQSWDEIIEYGKGATKEGQFGVSLGRINIFISGPYVWAQGGDYVNEDWTESLLDQPSHVNMLKFFRDIVCVHKITNDAPGTSWGEMNDIFTGKRAMMVHSGGGFVGLIRREFPELWEVLGVCPIPGPKVGQKSSFIGGNVASITTQTKNKQEAGEFLLWVTASDEGMAVTGDIGFLPGCPSGLDLPVYQKDKAIYEPFRDGLEKGYPSWNHPLYEELQNPLEVAWMDAVLGEKDMDEIVDKCHEEVNRILHR